MNATHAPRVDADPFPWFPTCTCGWRGRRQGSVRDALAAARTHVQEES